MHKTYRQIFGACLAIVLLLLHASVLSAPVEETFERAAFTNHNDLSPSITVRDFEYEVQAGGSLKTVIGPAALYPGFDPARPVTSFIIRHSAGAEFNFLGFDASNQFEMSESVNVSGYRDDVLVAGPVQVVIPWPENSVDFSSEAGFDNVDEVRMENTDLYFFFEAWQRDDPVIRHDVTIAEIGNGSGITNGAGTYIVGTNVSLTAIAEPGSIFGGWSGDAVCASSFIMPDRDVNCTATFSLISYPITETANPLDGGSVNCTPNPVLHDHSSTCTASPTSGYDFIAFGGDCVGATCSLDNVTEAKSVTGYFHCVDALVPAGQISWTEVYQCDWVLAPADVEILSPGDVEFRAVHGISIGPGFRVGPEALFKAVIEP